jgi:NAD(P)H-hydrate epimerase
MSTLPSSLYRAAQVRELDRRAIEEFGIPGYELMCRAGAAAFSLLRTRWPEARRLCVLCGVGNNGGDGYVLARLAHEAGIEVRILQLGEPSRLAGDALRAYGEWSVLLGNSDGNDSGDVDISASAYSDDLLYSLQQLSDVDVIVDAILGTGIEREVEGEWRHAIESINHSGTPVLALDVPSGLHSDTGAVLGQAVQAQATISFIGLKQGLFTAKGPDCCGVPLFDDLDVPQEVYAQMHASARLLQHEMLAYHLPPRPRGHHKGQHGHVLVVGGDYGYAGAALLAGEAAARCGAGLVSIATRVAHTAALTTARPELMCHGIERASQLLPLLEKASVVVIGPGLGHSSWASELLACVLEVDKPLVVDADALNLLAQEPMARGNWVLTPHPGEAARLLRSDAAHVQKDRFATLDALVDAYQGVCVLKGAGSLVGTPDGKVSLCRAGNPGMATGGMGDILSGVIAALIAQGVDLAAAAGCGVYLHAAAGDLAAREGERGLLASDLLAPLRRLVNPCKS